MYVILSFFVLCERAVHKEFASLMPAHGPPHNRLSATPSTALSFEACTLHQVKMKQLNAAHAADD